MFIEIRVLERCGCRHPFLGLPVLQAPSELHQSGNGSTADRVVRRSSQCPRNVEDVLKHGHRHQWHIFLEIFEVDDKGLEQTVKMKLRMGPPHPGSRRPRVVQIPSRWFQRLQVQERSQHRKGRSWGAVLQPVTKQLCISLRGVEGRSYSRGHRETELLLCCWSWGIARAGTKRLTALEDHPHHPHRDCCVHHVARGHGVSRKLGLPLT